MPETSASPAIAVNKIPPAYQWLAKEPAPKMLLEALSHYGTLEAKGPDNNPDITAWAKEIGGTVADVYKADEIPWCGLFMAICAKRSGYELPKDPLWALNWSTFGTSQPKAMLGDVLTFIRKTNTGAKAGHVSMYVGEDEAAYHVLGGNQSDSVCITRIDKSRMYSIRRADFKIGQPANVRQIFLSATGGMSTNEA